MKPRKETLITHQQIFYFSSTGNELCREITRPVVSLLKRATLNTGALP